MIDMRPSAIPTAKDVGFLSSRIALHAGIANHGKAEEGEENKYRTSTKLPEVQ